MAVPGILLTLPGVQQVANQGKNINLLDISIVDEETNLIDKVKNNLQEYIRQAESTEMKILNAFGFSNLGDISYGEKLLQDKFAEIFNNTGLNKFTGSELKREVLNQYEIKKSMKDNDFIRWTQTEFLDMVVEKAMQNAVNLLDPVGMSQMVVAALAGGSSKINIKGGTKIGQGKIFKNGNIMVQELSDNRYKNLQELYKQNKGKETYTGARFNINTVKEISTINGANLEIEASIDYYEATKGRKFSDIPKEEREEAKKLLKEVLLKQVTNFLGDDQDVRIVLSNMLDSHAENFFVGGNINDITGILGEFSTAVALRKLVPGARFQDIVDWTAKNESSGKQISSDFIIKFTNGLNIGVQVKNTTKDLIDLKDKLKIDFADADIKIIFNRLGDKYPEFKDNKNIMKLIYISSSFNVPYKGTFKNGRMTYGSTGDITFRNYDAFLDVRGTILSLRDKIDLFFKSFSPDLLFMATDENFQNSLANLDNEAKKIIQGNNLYVIGNKPIFVSTILKSIVNGLNELQVKVSAKNFSKESTKELLEKGLVEDKGDNTFSGGTIIDYLNEYGYDADEQMNGVDWKKIRKASKYQRYQFTSSLVIG